MTLKEGPPPGQLILQKTGDRDLSLKHKDVGPSQSQDELLSSTAHLSHWLEIILV